MASISCLPQTCPQMKALMTFHAELRLTQYLNWWSKTCAIWDLCTFLKIEHLNVFQAQTEREQQVLTCESHYQKHMLSNFNPVKKEQGLAKDARVCFKCSTSDLWCVSSFNESMSWVYRPKKSILGLCCICMNQHLPELSRKGVQAQLMSVNAHRTCE